MTTGEIMLFNKPQLFEGWTTLSTGKISIQWLAQYVLDSTLSFKWCYPLFQQLGPVEGHNQNALSYPLDRD